MAVSSFAAKAGTAGAVTVGGGGLAGTYLAWDHITLYAVEREVINKDLKLKLENPVNNDKHLIKISVDQSDNSSKLSDGYEWSCEITIDPNTASNYAYNLVKRLSNNLPTTDIKSHKKEKTLLVKACAGGREFVDNNKDKIKGKLTLKQKQQDSDFDFKDYSALNDLLDFNLKTVENEVIEKDVKLTAASSSTSSPITVSVEESSKSKLTGDSTWTCEITLSNDVQGDHTNLANSIKSHLAKDNEELTLDQKKAKSELVKACSQNRKTNPEPANGVTGQLSIKKESENKTFENHSYLNYLLTQKN